MVMTLLTRPKVTVGTVVVAADGSGHTTDIQTGIDLLPATGGCVYIKEGTYNVVNVTLNVDNIHMHGCGRATEIICAGQFGIILNDVDNCKLSNFYVTSTWPGPALGECVHIFQSDNIEVNGLWVDGGYPTYPSTIGILLYTTEKTKIINNWVFNGGWSGIHLYQDNLDVIVSNNIVFDCYQYGIRGAGGGVDTDQILIISNIIKDTINGSGLSITSEGRWIIANNTIYSNNTNGINTTFIDGIISSNYCFNNGEYGISVGGNIEISNNYCIGNTLGTIADLGIDTQIFNNYEV